MNFIQGKAFNINSYILGKVTKTGKNIFARRNYILVRENLESVPSKYIAAISNTSISCLSKPFVKIDSNFDEFNEEDVILISTDGKITKLYDIYSDQNVIMATERCNHRCIMCPQPPITEEDDMTQFNLDLISLFNKNTREVGISGGEPTLIGDQLFTIINHIKKCLPKAGITILSNGVRFADVDYAMKLAMCNHHDLQIDIPLFSDNSSLHNFIVGANTFYKTVRGLYNLAIFRQKIGIRIVIHKLTYKRLPQLADFIYHNFPFVGQVAFMEMEPYGLAKENLDNLWIDPYDYNEELRDAVLFLRDRNMSPLIYNAQLCVLPEDIREFAVKSISTWKDIYISECQKCLLKEQCPGFFSSNLDIHSSHIRPFLANDDNSITHNIKEVK